jgi:Mg2+ and Co2+ transporter CorA
MPRMVGQSRVVSEQEQILQYIQYIQDHQSDMVSRLDCFKTVRRNYQEMIENITSHVDVTNLENSKIL